MRHRARRWLVTALVASATLLLTAAPAWAPHVAQLSVSPREVPPGGQVTVWGIRGYGADNPVKIRLDSVDGPVLGELPTDDQFFAALPAGTVTIPEDTPPGRHLLVATQVVTGEESNIRGVPARAEILVLSGTFDRPIPPPEVAAPVEVAPRPAGLLAAGTGDRALPAGWLGPALLGVGVAGLTLFAAAVALLASLSRRRSTA